VFHSNYAPFPTFTTCLSITNYVTANNLDNNSNMKAEKTSHYIIIICILGNRYVFLPDAWVESNGSLALGLCLSQLQANCLKTVINCSLYTPIHYR